MKKLSLALSLALGIVLITPLVWGTTAGDWPHWRGMSYDGSVTDESFKIGSGMGFKVAWRKDLGSGYSSVSVTDGRAITMFSDEKNDYLIAFDADTGKELWRYRIDETYDAPEASFDGPLSTPAIDEQRVYAIGPKGQIFAVDVSNGKKVWEASMVALDSHEPNFGWTTSPLIAGEVLIVQTGADLGEEEEEEESEAEEAEAGEVKGSSVTGFDKKSGTVLWTLGDDSVNYQSPILAKVSGMTQVVCATDNAILGLDPATGAQLWQLRHEGRDTSVTPLAVGDRIYLRHAFREGMLIAVSKEGDSYSASEVWTSRDIKNSHDSSVYHDGYLYGYSGPFLTCVDAKTGERTWRSRQPGEGFTMLVNDNLVVLTRDGGLYAVKARPDVYEEVASLELFDDISWAPPSFANGKVYARTFEEIACVVPAETAAALQVERPTDVGKVPGSKFAAFVKEVEVAEDKAAVIDAYLEKQTFPIIEDERLLHLVYRGEVEEIAVAGDFLETGETQPMNRIGETDLYYFSVELDPDAFISYNLQKDFEEVITDPLNPDTVNSFGTEQSVVGMPKWEDSDHLDEFRLESFEHESKITESSRQIRVYLPPFYHTSDERYPVLYVNYGAIAIDSGLMPRSLDALIGRTVRPVIAVFIQRSPETQFREISGDLKEAYVQMIAEELVPLVDQRYRTIAEPDSRALMGASAGGFSSVLTAFLHPGVFGWVVGQSCNLGGELGEQLTEVVDAATEKVPTRFFLHWGKYDVRNERQNLDRRAANKQLVEQLEAKGHEVYGGEMSHGYGWGSWRTVNDTILETLFPLEKAE